jgi:hypothetical protein
MRGKAQNLMLIGKPMNLMVGTDINKNMFSIIIRREAMEGENHKDEQVAGPLLDRTFLHS